MKEQSAGGHNHVATGSSLSHHHGSSAASSRSDNNNGPKCFGGPCIDSEEEEDEDWDLGIGKLVIDLDADADKTRSPPSTKGAASTNNGSNTSAMSSNASPQKPTSKSGGAGIDSSMEKGIKMKIKRSGKSSASLTSSSTAASSLSTGGPGKQEHRQGGVKLSENRLGFNTALGDSTYTHHSTQPSTMDRLKHSLAEKERVSSSLSKNRSSSKKDRSSKSERAKGGNNTDSHPATGVGTFSLSAASSSLGVTSTNTTSAGLSVLASGSGVTSNVTVDLDRISMSPFGNPGNVKREAQPLSHDPYEFNAKVEDRIGVPLKKVKLEKNESSSSSSSISPCSTSTPAASLGEEKSTQDKSTPVKPPSTPPSAPSSAPVVCPERHDMSVGTNHVGVITDPDCLGPCEPGTSVVLEGIVWNETDNGLLVVNVTWRGKTYVGTLMDATKHDWAPPRLNCDSPTSDFDARTPKGRGKRGRTAAPPKPAENGSDRKLRSNRRNSNNNGGPGGLPFMASPSPARCDNLGSKRKRCDPDPAMFEPPKSSKRTRTESRLAEMGSSVVTGGENVNLIECPEPNCNKKYRHMNGLKYHQSHAHRNQTCTITSQSQVNRSQTSTVTSQSQVNRSQTCTVTSQSQVNRSQTCTVTSETCSDSKEDKSDDSNPPSSRSVTCMEESSASSKSTRKESSNDTKEATGSIKKKPDLKKVAIESRPQSDSNTQSKATVEPTSDSKDRTEKVAQSKEKENEDIKKVVASSAAVPTTAICEAKHVPKQPTAGLPQVTISNPAISTSSVMYQISGGQLGVVTSNVSLVTQASPTQLTVCTAASGLIQSPIVPKAVPTTTTLSTVPVPMAAVSTVTSGSMPHIPVKMEIDKKKKEKLEKSKVKPTSTTRPIMPAPATHVVSHAAISTQAGMSQVSTVTSLKPIQPKPTILGEPSKVNPALASLKEMKEKKQHKKKKNKDKDRDRERHKDGEKSHHHEHKTKVVVDMPSVIKTAPSAPRQVVEVAPVQKMDVSSPPQLEKQPPVGNAVKERPVAPVKGTLSVPAKPTEAGNRSVQSSQDQDAQSPAYSDISDANESAPTLEKETQPLPEEPHPNERPPSVQTVDGRGVYTGSPYYGQPPFLTPVVPAANVSGESRDSQVLPKTPVKPTENKESLTKPPKASASIAPKETEKPDKVSAQRPPSTSTGAKSSGSENKAASTQADKNDQQQKPVYTPQGQFQYVSPYYTVDPNYVQLMATNPEYREQRRRYEQQMRQSQGTSQQPQTSQQSQQHQSSSQQQQQQQQQHSSTKQHYTCTPQSQQSTGPQQPHPSQPVAPPHHQGAPQQQGSLKHQGAAPHHGSSGAKLQTTSQHSPHLPQQQQSQKNHPTQNHPPRDHPPRDHPPQVQVSHPHHAPQQQSQHHSPQIKQQQQKSQQQQSHVQQQSKGVPLTHHSNHSSQSQQVQRSHPPPLTGHHQSDSDRNKPHSSKNRAPSSESRPESNKPAKEDHKHKTDDKGVVSQKPPGLISDREREEQKYRDRERTEQNLREKQNENRQILKENIELKEQMDNRSKGESYDQKSLYDKQREELNRYYMYHQQRYLEQRQRYMEVPKSGQDQAGNKNQEHMTMSPHEKPEYSDFAKQHQPRPDSKRSEAERSHSREHSIPKGKEEERPKSVDRGSATNSPRATPKPKEQPGSAPANASSGSAPVSYTQYYPAHPYLQSQHYGGQMPFDPNHPGMYPGVNPVIGYAGPAYIHPSQIRYHLPNNDGVPPNDKAMMLSPGAGPQPEGKALSLLQQHASQYYGGSGAPPAHKIHELQEVAKRPDKARSTGSPAAKETERPDSRNSIVSVDGKPRDQRSPPTQRHLHTHHHTHVMGPSYPVQYSPYGTAIMTSPNGTAAQPVADSTMPPHNFVGK